MALALAAAARGPAGGQRTVAVFADHEAAQREIDAEVGAVGRAQAVEPVLDALMRLQADKRFVVALAARNVPVGSFDVARIDRITEHIAHTLMGNLAGLGFGVGGMLLQEADDIGLRFEPAGGVAFERFDNDGGCGLIADQHLAVQAGDASEAIAARRTENREAILEPRLHAVQRLLGVVDAVIVGKRDRHILHEPRR